MSQCGPTSLLGRMLRRKSLAAARSMDTPLSRCLTVWQLLFYGIAHMAGAGIYVLTGTVVKNTAGPAASLSFLMCGIASIFTGLCYVEFSTLTPKAGSCYTFTYITLGELPAFVIGWTMVADYVITMASVAKAFSGTIDSLVNHTVSNFVMEKLGELPDSPILDRTCDLMAVGLILILMLLVVTGANISMSVNVGLSVAQVLCLTLVGAAAFAYGSSANWQEAGGFFPFGVSGVLQAASITIFAFSGFECITNAAEESENPRRDLPIALLGSLAVVGILYVSVSLSLSYLEPYWMLDISSPFVTAFDRKGAKWAEAVAAVGTLLATGATKLATMYVIPRVLYALAADGVIFACFASVNEKVKVPLAGLFFGAGVSALLAMIFNIRTLADMVSMGVLLSYCAVGVDLFALRYLLFTQGKDSVELRDWAAAGCSTLLSRRNCLRFLLAAFVICSFVVGLTINLLLINITWWSITLIAMSSTSCLLLMLLLCIYKPTAVPDTYESPLMPLAPCIAIMINAIMIAKIQYQTWIRFAIWMAVGLMLYMCYGMQHSKAEFKDSDYVDLDRQEREKIEEEDEVEEKKPVLGD